MKTQSTCYEKLVTTIKTLLVQDAKMAKKTAMRNLCKYSPEKEIRMTLRLDCPQSSLFQNPPSCLVRQIGLCSCRLPLFHAVGTLHLLFQVSRLWFPKSCERVDHPLLPLLVILILEIGPLPLLEVLIRCYYLQDHQLGDLKWKEGRLS